MFVRQILNVLRTGRYICPLIKISVTVEFNKSELQIRAYRRCLLLHRSLLYSRAYSAARTWDIRRVARAATSIANRKWIPIKVHRNGTERNKPGIRIKWEQRSWKIERSILSRGGRWRSEFFKTCRHDRKPSLSLSLSLRSFLPINSLRFVLLDPSVAPSLFDHLLPQFLLGHLIDTMLLS